MACFSAYKLAAGEQVHVLGSHLVGDRTSHAVSLLMTKPATDTSHYTNALNALYRFAPQFAGCLTVGLRVLQMAYSEFSAAKGSPYQPWNLVCVHRVISMRKRNNRGDSIL